VGRLGKYFGFFVKEEMNPGSFLILVTKYYFCGQIIWTKPRLMNTKETILLHPQCSILERTKEELRVNNTNKYNIINSIISAYGDGRREVRD